MDFGHTNSSYEALIGLVNWNLKVLFSIKALSYSRSIVLGLGKQYNVFEQFISLEK
jgi:hypothetical protein